MPSRLGRYCRAIIEAGWLGAIVLIPLFFNVYSARVFEPDKLTMLRSIALVMIAAWLIKVIDEREWAKLSDKRALWRVPLVLPVAVLAGIYLVTTIFSLTPRVSLIGSYQRLQGTYTTLSYLVIFAMMLMHLRTKAQIDRLVTTIIITSVPISLYGLLQKYGLDPLPWGGDVQTRIASNMGNAIFVSAYLIMVTPLALGRIVEAFTSILTDDEFSWADVVRASIYIFIAAIHVLALVFSQSRGPLLGFLAGTFTFILILLVRLRDSDAARGRLKFKEIALAIGVLALANLIGFGLAYLLGSLATNQGWISTASRKLEPEAMRAALLGGLGFLGAMIGGVASIFILTAVRKGWRWLWLNWIVQAALVGGFLVLFNLPNTPIADWRHLPYIGRIGTALDTQSGTAQVRFFIWKGAVEMISPHEPIEFPDGRQDPFNAIRPLVGYGPESMYVGYNRFYPPELAHVEKRNASPDRSHNETFDALVITGWAGFLAWQVLYGSLFFFGFRWLGVIRSKTDKALFFALVLGIGIVSAIIFWQWLGIEFTGVAFPFGELAGLLAYLAYYALFSKPAEKKARNPNTILLIALLSAAIAHFAEIHFGIAIAATRTYFFAYAALAVVVGHLLPQAAARKQQAAAENSGQKALREVDRKQRRKRHRQASARAVVSPNRASWIKPVLVGGLIMGLVLGTLAYEFTTNPMRPDAESVPGTGEILWSSLTKNPQKEFAATYAALGLFTLTLVLGGALVVSEASKNNRLGQDERKEIKGLVIYLGTAISIGFLFMAFQAGRLRFLSMGAGATQDDSTLYRVQIAADATASLLAAFYFFVFILLLGLAFALMHGRQGQSSPWSAATWVALAVGVIASFVLIDQTNLNVIQADIVYKQADPWDKRAMREKHPAIWDLAIAEYNHALELAPLEDFYYLWLGRAYLEQSAVMTDPVKQQQLMEIAKSELYEAQRINPLNTDHAANLARLHTRWAELASSDVERTTKANQANEHYAQAHNLSPHNAVILNEWAMLLAGLFGDCEGGLEKLNESLALDDRFATTYQNMGNVALTCGDRTQGEEKQAYYRLAEEAYLGQLNLAPCDLQAHTALGYAQSQIGKPAEAIKTNLAGLGCVADPTSSRTVQFHRNLSILYQQQGNLEDAVIHARSAAQAAGNNTSSLLDAARILVSLNALDDAYQAALRLGSLELQVWNQLRDLAVLFSQVGRPGEGIPFAQQALQLAPEAQQQGIQDLIAALQTQATP